MDPPRFYGTFYLAIIDFGSGPIKLKNWPFVWEVRFKSKDHHLAGAGKKVNKSTF